MNKTEAVKHILAQVAQFMGEQINEVELFDNIESYIKMVNMTSEKPEGVKCPECGGEMISRKGAYGVFWGCKKYPKCRGTRDSEGKSKEDRDREKASKVEPQDEMYRFNRGK